ncbi:MAG: T9SS type A sorting domain-containing protein [Rhodothermales bacterium]
MKTTFLATLLIFQVSTVIAQGGPPQFNSVITALEFDAEGRLYVGGFFSEVAGMPAVGLVRWDGAAWEPLGDGTMDVGAMRFVGDTLYVGGENLDPHANHEQVARWTPEGFEPFGTFRHRCCGSPTIYAIEADPNGGLIVAGNFTEVDTFFEANSLARWRDAQWETIGARIEGTIIVDDAMDAVLGVLTDSQNVYIAGLFDRVGTLETGGLAKWTGSAWEGLATGPESVYVLVFGPEGSLYAGGGFTDIDGKEINRIARWDGTAWEPLGAGIDGEILFGSGVSALAADAEYVYAAGDFESAGGIPANNIARWDGQSWEPLGGGLNSRVDVLRVGPDGSLYAAGFFTEAGGVPVSQLARWDGERWHAVGIVAPVGTEEVDPAPGDRFSLFPNPADSRFTVGLDVSESGPVRVLLYDLLGRHVATPLDAWLPAGSHRMPIDVSPLSAGIYLVWIEHAGQRKTSMLRVIH